jgi:DNA-binding beta-propeller fold protein YncE
MNHARTSLRSLALLTLTACAASESSPVAAPAPAPAPVTVSHAEAPAPVAPALAAPSATRTPGDATKPAGSAPATLGAREVALPGATAPASLDYIAVERAAGRVWVPVGNTGSVDVFTIASGAFTRVDGFATAERDMRGTKRTVGPSAVSLGDGFAFIGNRATSEVCAVDVKSLKLGKCVKLGSPTDGVAYVAAAKEVWVTTPRDRTLTVLDASHPEALKVKTTVKVDGEPEGYAMDDARGLFFTNLEDQGGTVVIDVKTHKPTAKWSAGCGSDGPRGLAFDAARGFLFVACTDHVQVLDARHDGALLGKVDTGTGVDNLDYLETKGLLYVAAGKDARLSVIRVDDKGQLAVVAVGATGTGARNAVADASGTAYVADSHGARLFILTP